MQPTPRAVRQNLIPSVASRISDCQYRFCAGLDCATVYFAEDGTFFYKDDLTIRIGIKERTAPRQVCYCFNYTLEEIDAEVREAGQSTILDEIKARLKIGCRCEVKNPQGSCCLGTVSKYVKLALVASAAREWRWWGGTMMRSRYRAFF